MFHQMDALKFHLWIFWTILTKFIISIVGMDCNTEILRRVITRKVFSTISNKIWMYFLKNSGSYTRNFILTFSYCLISNLLTIWVHFPIGRLSLHLQTHPKIRTLGSAIFWENCYLWVWIFLKDERYWHWHCNGATTILRALVVPPILQDLGSGRL